MSPRTSARKRRESVPQIRNDLPEKPGIPHGAAGRHDAVAAGFLEHQRRVPGGENVSVSDDRNAYGFLHLPDALQKLSGWKRFEQILCNAQ